MMISNVKNIDEFADAISGVRSSGSVWRVMERFCHSHDMGSVAYILAAQDAGPEGKCGRLIEETSNLSGQFDQDYIDAGAVNFDPFLQWGCSSFAPRNFGTAFAADLPDVAPNQLEFLDHAAKSGVPLAMGIPVALREQAEYGGWIVGSSSGTARQFRRLQTEVGERVRLAAMIAHERMSALRHGQQACQKMLSPRERECLIWLSLGLRTGQIADRLGLSVSAVRLYHANARKKLCANTREHAVALAIVRGEIIL